MARPIVSTISLAAVALWLFHGFATAATPLKTVALFGRPAPGLPNSISFGERQFAFLPGFGTPIINASGQLAFSAHVIGPGVNTSNERGIWSGTSPSDLRLVARAGEPAPSGIPDDRFGAVNPLGIASDGRVTFANSFESAWQDRVGGTQLVWREGNPVPGLPPLAAPHVDFVSLPIVNPAGQIAFVGQSLVAPPSLDDSMAGLWVGDATGLRLVARTDLSPPGVGLQVLRSITSISLNDLGKAVFSGLLSSRTSLLPVGYGAWSEHPEGGLRLVTRSGAQVPGEPGVVLFTVNSFATTGWNNAGQAAFLAGFSGPDVGGSGIWSEGGGQGLRTIAKTETPAPGDLAGLTFLEFSSPVLNGAGQVAFGAFLSDAAGQLAPVGSLWIETRDRMLEPIAYGGQLAPGLSGNFRYSSFGDTLGNVALNVTGQAAFSAQARSGPEENPSFIRGIWARDLSGALRLVAHEGQTIDVDDGPGVDMRAIAELAFESFSGNQDGRASGLSDGGQIAFWAEFTDGSEGVFVSNALTVPEPNFLVLIFPLSVCVATRRFGVLRRGRISSWPANKEFISSKQGAAGLSKWSMLALAHLSSCLILDADHIGRLVRALNLTTWTDNPAWANRARSISPPRGSAPA